MKTTFRKNCYIWLQRLIPQHLVSQCAGWFANQSVPFLTQWAIKKFIKHYQVNLCEAVREQAGDYHSFNDFFTRQLKTSSRPIANTKIVSPCDGTIMAADMIQEALSLQCKGHEFSLEQLLADKSLANTCLQGAATTIYLSPANYHRVHMPIDGYLVSMRHIPGKLFSVNECTQSAIPGLFSLNERLVLHFSTEIGPIIIVLVGAMIVGSIATEWAGIITPSTTAATRHWQYARPLFFKKGDDLAHFRLGSTVILITPPGGNVTLPNTGESVLIGQRLFS